MQTIANHHAYLMPRQVAIIERADAFEDGCQLFLGSFAETDTDNFDELLPTDKITKVADSFDQLISRIHV